MAINLRPLLGAFLVAVLPSLAASQGPYNVRTLRTENLDLNVSIPTFPEAGIKVSGTNVNFTISAVGDPWIGVPPEPPYSGNGWTWAKLVKINLKIVGTDLDHDYVQPNGGTLVWQSGGTVDPVAVACRFASTHFADNANIPIRVKAFFKVGRGTVEAPTDPTDKETPDLDVVPIAYNKALIMGTQEEYYEQDEYDHGYYLPGHPANETSTQPPPCSG